MELLVPIILLLLLATVLQCYVFWLGEEYRGLAIRTLQYLIQGTCLFLVYIAFTWLYYRAGTVPMSQILSLDFMQQEMGMLWLVACAVIMGTGYLFNIFYLLYRRRPQPPDHHISNPSEDESDDDGLLSAPELHENSNFFDPSQEVILPFGAENHIKSRSR